MLQGRVVLLVVASTQQGRRAETETTCSWIEAPDLRGGSSHKAWICCWAHKSVGFGGVCCVPGPLGVLVLRVCCLDTALAAGRSGVWAKRCHAASDPELPFCGFLGGLYVWCVSVCGEGGLV